MLSVKQDSIKYHFLNLWYDSTWDWTPVSQTIGTQSSVTKLKKHVKDYIYRERLGKLGIELYEKEKWDMI